MNKSIIRKIAIALALLIAGVISASADVRIAFLRPAGWQNVPHIHAYANDTPLPGCNNQQMIAVPGMDGWFWFAIPGSPSNYNVMFNNGDWDYGKSSDFYLSDSSDHAFTSDGSATREISGDAVWAVLNGGGSTTDPTPGTTYTNIRIAFQRPAAWSKIPHIHVYHAVPGSADVADVYDQPMNPVPGKSGWYFYTIPSTVAPYQIIFNNGGWGDVQLSDYRVNDGLDHAFTTDGSSSFETDGSAIWDAIDNPRPEQPVEGQTVRFYRPEGWTQTPHLVAYKEKQLDPVPENRVIYEVFVRNFSPEGTFKGVEKQVNRLKELGVDVVWLMPVYPGGQEGKWGTYASPYAVRDYKALDPDYGSTDDFRSLVNAIHDAGMEVWLDWVANHTALDHPWTREHRDYYQLTGNDIVHPFGWNDVYQLNYSSRGLRDAMIDALCYWVREFDIDGYRCDYADGVPRDFWQEARNAVNAIKPLSWLAESGGDGDFAYLVGNNGPFDYNYAWGFRDQLAEFAGHGNVNALKELCTNLFYDSKYNGKSRMVYLTNHDVVQDKGGTEDRIMGNRLEPLTVLEFTIYGMPLLYNGQEIRYSSAAVSLAEKTPVDWSRPDTRMNALISSLCKLKHSEPALRTGAQRGELNICSVSHGDVLVYERRLGSESVVVMLNFSGSQANFTIDDMMPEEIYLDVFSGNSRSLASGDSFTLPAYGYAVYVK